MSDDYETKEEQEKRLRLAIAELKRGKALAPLLVRKSGPIPYKKKETK